MKFNPSFLLPIFILLCGTVTAQKQVLDNKMHHLRHGTQREWNDFPFKAEDSQLVMHFDVKSEILLGTISLRQFDISQLWQVSLNGRLDHCRLMKKDMIVYFELPAGLLRTKDNLLEIRAEEGNDPEHPNNDIRIGQILLDSRPLNQILIEASVQVVIQDADQGTPLPSRLTITDRQGSLQPVSVAADDLIAARTGVIYTGNGRVAFSLPAGSYKLYASRGFEYGVDSIPLTLGPGDHVQRLSIHHEVQAGNWIGCDPHIHTLMIRVMEMPQSGAALLTIAGEGIAMPVMTDHNAAVVVNTEVEEMGLKDWITPVVGDEVTTSIGHFNIFPVDSGSRVPDYHVQDWNQLSDNIEMHKEVQVVILNHARDFHNGFKPFDPKAHIAIAGKSLRGWRFPANAMEVMNSGSQQTNPRQLYLDWMGMMNRGIFLAPVGSSDSHEVSRYRRSGPDIYPPLQGRFCQGQ